jgi:hypothetical protein
MARQLELPFGKTTPKTTVLGVTRSAIGLTVKASSLTLRGIGKLIAYGHDAVDEVSKGYQNKRSKS